MGFRYGEWSLDLERGEATRGEAVARLSTTECKLLAFLVASPGRVFSRRALLTEVWGYHPASRSRAVDTTVARVRGKLEDDPDDPRFLLTVHGEGYRFVERDEASAPPARLPQRADRFHGRSAELAALAAAVGAGERLIVVVGPGGMGKTRLAEQFARGSHGFDAVWFADATDADSADDVDQAVTRAVGARVVEGITAALAAPPRGLLVLDNVEQVADVARHRVGQWAAAAPNATFLLTSRVDLAFAGSRALHLDPLRRDDAVALFVDRARETTPGDPDVVSLVDALEGWPLAIELAAARTRAMTVAQIRVRLTDRLGLLADPRSDRPARHATLRATLDWSWDLLTPAERVALGQLSVFEDGFTLEAAEAVLEVDGWVPDVVQGLVDNALVRFDPVRERYRMLVPVQAYAAEHTAADALAAAGRRHFAFFAQYGAQEALSVARDQGLVPVSARLIGERANLKLARERASVAGDHEAAAVAALALADVLKGVGPLPAALPHLGAALVGDSTRSIDLLCTRAAFLNDMGRLTEALADIEDALRRCSPTHPLRARALRYRSMLQWNLGDADGAIASAQAAIDVTRALGDLPGEALGLTALARRLWRRGRPDEARAAQRVALDLHRSLGNRNSEAVMLRLLGDMELGAGRLRESRAAYEGSLALFRSIGGHLYEASTSAAFANVVLDEGDAQRAQEMLEAAMAAHQEAGAQIQNVNILGDLGRLLIRVGRLDDAERHLADSASLADSVGAPGAAASARSELARVRILRGLLDAAAADLDAAEPAVRGAMIEGEVARLVATRAHLLAARGDHAAARDALANAETIAATAGIAASHDFALRVAAVRRLLPAAC